MTGTPPPPVRTRFAPSPSGHLHVGGARTALFCWAYARAKGGRFLLRIEDTDRKRSSEAATRAILEDLAWLAIEWDEGPQLEGCGGGETGPYYQSKRLEHYRHYTERLIETGGAYRAFETPQELEAARETEGHSYRYDRAALSLEPETITRYLAEQRPYVVRFKAPKAGEITIHDVVRGETTVAAGELDDFIILKADGYPTYHLAVVVDDELMGVTHVIRGQEHLANTAKHVVLQDALGLRRPVYAHVSLIFNPDGSKMSKRERDRALRREVKRRGLERPPPGEVISDSQWQWWLSDKDHQIEPEAAKRLATALEVELPEIDVEDFRRAGYLPEVMVNYLALLGWSPGGSREKFDRDFLARHFDLERVIKSPARFDREKLLAFNLDALQAMSPRDFAQRLRGHGDRYHPEFLEKLGNGLVGLFAAANHKRSKTLEDPFRSCRFFVVADDEVVYEKSKAVRKTLRSGGAHLEALAPLLRALPDWSLEGLETLLKGYADEHADGKLGSVAQPLRIAVSGTTISPAIFETLFILGQEAVLNRIERCLEEGVRV